MTGREKAFLIFMIWLAVYPSVLLMSYALGWIAPGWPLWLEILVSTLATVPLISLLAAPKVEALIAKARGQSPAELKLDEARSAPGPSPEEQVR